MGLGWPTGTTEEISEYPAHCMYMQPTYHPIHQQKLYWKPSRRGYDIPGELGDQ